MTPRTLPHRLAAAGLAAAITAVLLVAGIGAWRASTVAPPGNVHARAVAIERTLRCPTCQGLSVADSPSPIAAGIRQQVEQQVHAGRSAHQIRAYFTARYSDWILLDPPRRGLGWLVWAAPPLLLLAGGALLWRATRRRPPHRSVTDADLQAAERFANHPLPVSTLSEPVAAALTDVDAARTESDLDPTAHAAVTDALRRLAYALARDASAVTSSPPPPTAGPDATSPDATSPEPSTPRRLPRRLLPATLAVIFAAVLGVGLDQAVSQRPPGALPTGRFATIGTATTPAVSAATPSPQQLANLRHQTQLRPNSVRAWLAYATALDSADRLADAEPAYRRVLHLDPTNVTAREQLAWLLTRGGSPDEALTVLRPLTRQRPDDPQLLLLLGLAQRGANQPAATATLQRYLRLAPDGPEAPIVRTLLGQSP